MRSDIKFKKAYYGIVSQKADGWLIYCQVFRSITYLLMLFSILKNWNNKIEKNDILFLNVVGAIVFYLIWEVKSDYSIPFLVLFCCLASDGMAWYCDVLRRIKENKLIKSAGRTVKKIAMICVGLFGMIAVLLLKSQYHNYVKKNYDFSKNCVAMNGIKSMEKFDKIEKNKENLTQYINVDKPFNVLKLYCKKLSGKGAYTIRLYDISGKNKEEYLQEWKHLSSKQIQHGQEKGSLLYDEGNEKGYLLLSCSQLLNEGKYMLQICPENGKDSIGWYYNAYKRFDYYDGDLFQGNQKRDGELAICMFHRVEQPYMKQSTFYFLEMFLFAIIVCSGGCLLYGEGK